MANEGDSGAGGLTDQQLQAINAQDYQQTGGNLSDAVIRSDNTVGPGSNPTPTPTPYGDPYATGGGGSAAYNVGGGHTRWDEFIQQMALEQQKLEQAKQLQESQLAQQKQLEEERLAEQQKIADQNTVEAWSKEQLSLRGPKDPYGYLFGSRDLAAPQGYKPAPLAMPDAVITAAKNQGIDLAGLQKQVSGDQGPSFIQGYLGSMPASNQQGPMGFQNTPQFQDLAPGSQESQQAQQGLSQTPSTNANQPVHMAGGGIVGMTPPAIPGRDSVPAVLTPGEGVLTQQGVQRLGGPQAVNNLNVQHFAMGGMVQGADAMAGSPYPGPFQTLGGGSVGAQNPNSWQNSTLPQGYRMLSPGVASNGLYNMAPTSWSGGGPMTADRMIGPAAIQHNPIQSFPHQQPFQSFAGAPLLTGGIQNPIGPANGPPMNLNMLDPYTRSQVDMFGRPQAPSAQALANMPQSGQQAYQDYVEKVAGGNYQDLLDQGKLMNPQGANPSSFSFA